MESLPRLRARISSLHDLRELMQALRVLAASHLQEAQGALPGIRQYVRTVEDAIAAGASLLPAPVESGLAEPAGGPSVLIMLGSEHGFAGSFNDVLLDRVQEARRPGQQLAVIGSRGAVFARDRGLAPAWTLPMATHVAGVLGVARQAADALSDISSADVLFLRHRPGAGPMLELQRLLPLAPVLMARGNGGTPPLHHLDPAILLQRLAGEYLLAEITGALMESLAGENAARLHAMERADRSIDDKLTGLAREEQVMRQEGITSELLDVVTGARAILEGAG